MSDDEGCYLTPLARSFGAAADDPFTSPKAPPERGLLLILLNRAQWSAEPSTGEVAPLDTPASNVVLHWTDTSGCDTKGECSKLVWLMQKKHMREEGHPDIQYNFLVGSDGYVFEGLGWTRASPMSTQVAEGLEGSSVFVGLLGTKSENSSPLMKTSLASLVTTGILEGFLQEDHRLLSLSNGNISQPLTDNASDDYNI